MANTLPASERDLMQQLVEERWHMLTMDTEVDNYTGVGSAIASETYERLTGTLAYIANRLAGDGFEGEAETQDLVNGLIETIADRLCSWAVDHRLGEATPKVAAA